MTGNHSGEADWLDGLVDRLGEGQAGWADGWLTDRLAGWLEWWKTG